MAVIFRGSTPTITLKPTNGMHVSELGVPTVAISQDLTFLSYTVPDVTIDTQANTISVTLPESDSILLTGGVDTYVQQAWANESTGKVVRFPRHSVEVEETLLAELLPQGEPE